MNQRVTLETKWVNVIVQRKRRKKYFMEEVKIFDPRTTTHPPTSFQIYLGQVQSKTPKN